MVVDAAEADVVANVVADVPAAVGADAGVLDDEEHAAQSTATHAMTTTARRKQVMAGRLEARRPMNAKRDGPARGSARSARLAIPL